MRVRPSLLLVAMALAAFVAAQTAFGSTGPAGAAQGPAFRPAVAYVPAAAARAKGIAPRVAPAPRPHLIAVPRGDLVYSAARGGAPAGTLAAKTEFGSQQVLSVAARRGAWLGVVSSALPNGRLAWIKRSDVSLRRTRWTLHADLSTHTLSLRRGQRVVRRINVAIGRAGSETPTGRFAVTDKLAGTSYGPYYGCCILALSGHQPNTPAGWKGGNRIAIHGTDSPSTIGTAASAGCLRAADADLRVLMARVPVGTPVFIAA